MSTEDYTAAWAVAAEGARIGLVTCRRCGVTLTLDMQIDVMAVHDEWHGEPFQSAVINRGPGDASDAS